MKKILFFLVFVTNQIIWASQDVLASSRLRVTLNSKIDLTEKSDLSLYDMVVVDKANYELLKKLSEIKINKTSSHITMTREEMLKVIRQVNLENFNLQWMIPDLVEVQFHEQIEKSEIERKVANHLRTLCEECDFEVQIDHLPTYKSKDWQISFQDVTLKNSYLLSARADEKSYWISVRQKIFKTVPVSTRWIPALQRVQPGDVELKRADISNLKDGFLSVDQIVGASLLRSIPIGSVVSAADIKREAAVKRGQVLKAQIESADFEISVSAIAEEPGFIGDVIKIKTNDKQMSAKVKDNGSVVVL